MADFRFPGARFGLQPRGDEVQVGLAIAEGFERLHRFDHVIAIGARSAVALPDVMHALRQRQSPGILDVAAVDDEAERPA